MPFSTEINDSASVRKAILFSRFFNKIALNTNTEYVSLLSAAQFNFFKTISSSIEMSLIGSARYSILHRYKYDDDLPLDSFKGNSTSFMHLPNLLFLLFNSVFDSTLRNPSLLHRRTIVPYNTRTLVLNFLSLGNKKLDSLQLSNLRFTEQTNIGFLNKLSTFDSRRLNFYFNRLSLSKSMVSKVHGLILDRSLIGTF
jgi:hypothetical protein